MFILWAIIVLAILLVGLFAVMANYKRRRPVRGNDQSGMTSDRGNPEPPKVGRATGPD